MLRSPSNSGPAFVRPNLPFDICRQVLLNSTLPNPRLAGPLESSSTVSSGAGTPIIIHEWHFLDIEHAIGRYFETVVTAADEAALVWQSTSVMAHQHIISTLIVSAEDHIRICLSVGPVNNHHVAATTVGDGPATSDVHAKMLSTAGQSSVLPGGVGISDYVFYDDNIGIVKGIMQAKTPWKIVPKDLNVVLYGVTHVAS